MKAQKYYHLASLGCPKNLVDSEMIAAIAEAGGYRPIEDPQQAEIIVVNTCGFILDAKQESINTLLEMAEWRTGGACKKLVGTGCFVSRYWEEVASQLPEIDEWIGLQDFIAFRKLFGVSLQKTVNRKLLTPKHYAYLRISDGCNNHCSYCVIPSIRGNLKSEPKEVLIAEARRLAAEGVKELIITAQDITQYGIDRNERAALSDLLRELHAIEEIKWIRLLYMHPANWTDELIDTIASLPKVCHYFDIPLQHISDPILQSMNRHINKADTVALLDKIRDKMPDVVLRTTFIVGYPQEGRTEFNELKQFVKEQQFGKLGVFTYSLEEGTIAADLPHLPASQTAERRKDALMTLQQEISESFLMRYVGKKIAVIIDQVSTDAGIKYEGRAWFDAPEIDGIVFITDGEAQIGDIVTVQITDSWEYDLIGVIAAD